MFGGFDLQRYAKSGTTNADIIWTPVIDDGWTIPLSGVKVMDGARVEIKAEQLTLDTGLSYALVPPRDIASLVEVVRAGSNFTCKQAGPGELELFDCNCTEKEYGRVRPLQLQIG
jgi:hypothetical protein